MPRAYDPSLVGQQLPIDHNPLDRIEYRTAKPEFDLDAIMAQVSKFVQDYLFPVIEDLTGIDLSIFLPLLNLLELDFSTPEAFLTSLFAAIMALPGALIEITLGVIEQLVHPDNSDMLTSLLTGLIGLLASLPTLLIQLATSLINSGAGLLGIQSPLNALNLFNLVPTNLLGQLNFSNIGEWFTNLVADPVFQNPLAFLGIDDWIHDDAPAHAGTGAAKTTADGATHELLGNLIPVSPGQILNLSTWTKWSGLTGTGNPVQLGVTGYTANNDATAQATIASHNTTPPTTDWTHLSGTYTVPDNVYSLRTRLTVTSTASAGDVWFDDVSATKTQNIFQRLVAGTDPGDTLTNDIEGLFSGVVTNALELLNRAGLTDFNNLVEGLGGPVGNQIEDAIARVNTFLHNLSPLNANNINTGAISDMFVPGLTTINDNLVTRLLQITGSGFGHTNAGNALQSTTYALIDASARVAKLEAIFNGGAHDGDDFERVNSSTIAPAGQWLVYYNGGAGTWATPNGHDATWSSSGINNREFIAIRNTGVLRSETDIQYVSMVLSSKAPEWFGYCGHNDLLLRISDATTGWANLTCIRIRFGGDGSLSIVRFVNGVPTTLNSRGPGSITPPGPGASIAGTAGELGTLRVFRAYIGGSMLLEAPEVGTASGLGAAYRRWGHGGRAEGHLLPTPGQDGPGGVRQWTAKDDLV